MAVKSVAERELVCAAQRIGREEAVDGISMLKAVYRGLCGSVMKWRIRISQKESGYNLSRESVLADYGTDVRNAWAAEALVHRPTAGLAYFTIGL
ncbi:hypothetical protein [Paenibacillus sp. MMO-177]|uniref:hypothetical protein n=1 Tax=Paenibacillus sp. MMO-177 TaxID=3081289 RepID=UPI003016DD97